MHVIVWEFRVAEEKRGAFEKAYGAAGAWVALFEKGDGYEGTELLRDETDSGRYLTIDRWTSSERFDRFKETFGDAYDALDRKLEGLSTSEVKIGAFETDQDARFQTKA
jgi:heme-degrading monooxygenase HmoA